MVNLIYSPQLQINTANASDSEAQNLDLHLPFSYEFVSSKMYDKRNGFDFYFVNFPFLFDGGFLRSLSL